MKNPNVPPEKHGGTGSRTAGRLAAAITAVCVGVNCTASESAMRQGPPPPLECPQEAIDAMLKLQIPDRMEEIAMPGYPFFSSHKPVSVTEGDTEIVLTDPRGRWRKHIPVGTALIGQFIFGDRLYGRFTQLRLPTGETFPFCGMLFSMEPMVEEGLPWLPGSQPGARKVLGRALMSPQYEGTY